MNDAKLQDSNAFASLFAITYKEQYKLAYSFLWDRSLAQDALLDLYLNALHSLRRLDDPKEFINWIGRMNAENCELLADARDISPPPGRPKIPIFPLEDAERLLEYIFMEEDWEPNSLPLETLVEYNEYRIHRYSLRKYLIALVILAFVSAPLLLIEPKIELKLDRTATFLGLMTYRFTNDSIIPVDTAVAQVDGKEVPVLQDGEKSYYILPTTNGKLTVTVRFLNHRSATDTVTVSGLDREVPKIISSRIFDGKLHLTIKDGGSGVYWQKIYATDPQGRHIEPDSFNGILSEVIFDFSYTGLNVFIPDRSGNVLHAQINHKSNRKEKP